MKKCMYIVTGVAIAVAAGQSQAAIDGSIGDAGHQIHNLDLTGGGNPAIRGGYADRNTLGEKQHALIPEPEMPAGDPEPTSPPLVPLPPAAWAGAAMLAAIAGGRYIRRRK